MARGSSASRTVTWLMLAAYAAVVSGVPLPIAGSPPAAGSPTAERLADKDRSRPFPCMDKPCGCATAEQCFSTCCCNSPAELLAWAETNHVDPATLLVLRRRVATAAPASDRSSCCSSTAASTSCCDSVTEAPAPDDCRACQSRAAAPSCSATAEPDPIDQPAPVEDGTSAPMPSKVISLKAMLACGGVLAGWTAAVTSLPPPATLRCESCMRLVGMISITDEIGRSVDPLRDAPPPRA